ncbi:aspartic peptidase domain-containing protein [Xylariaceae sp. FL1019]|nr:aspartic peptidase domain-containing protein [Xylariaceae sp. FL1019]
MACTDITPLQLPITDIQVLPNIPDSYMRGIKAGVGDPVQDIVVLPWAELNNTWIYDTTPYCDETIIWNDLICDIRRGDLYDEGNSTTFAKEDDVKSAGGASIETQGNGSELGISKLLTSSLGGTETFGFESGSSLHEFPIGIPRLNWDHGYTMLHAMGMGANSTLLNALYESKQIGARAWSFFWGRESIDPDGSLDGSLVLGGYDQQKTIGANYSQALDYSDSTGCWTGMKVIIASIQLNFRNGSDIDMLPPNTSLDVCLVPQRQLLLEAPHSLIDTFEDLTGMTNRGTSFGLHWTAFLYDAVNSFDGDMTISLSNGLNVRIDNSQYLVPFVEIQRNGSRVFNTSTTELLINGVVDQPATLGRYFFTAAYLMVNHDENIFTLWRANPSTESKLVPAINRRANSCDNNTAQTDQASFREPYHLSKGIIAGITLGSLGLILVLIFAIIFYLRSRKRKAVSPSEKTAIAGGGQRDQAIDERFSDQGPLPKSQELYGSFPTTKGLNSQGRPALYELPGGQGRWEMEASCNTLVSR